MSALQGLTERTPPVAFRLIVAALEADDALRAQILEAVPSGSARVTMAHLVNVASTAIQRLAEIDGVDPVDELVAIWPPREAVT